jgi:hypothetical protein
MALLTSCTHHLKLQVIQRCRCSLFTVRHTVGFSVLTTPILATDFNRVVIPVSHMKSSLESSIPFLSFLLNYSDNCQFRNST